MKCITSFLVLSIAVIINGCSMMKSNIETQFSNIKLISGFPSGEAGYDLGVSACYAGFIGDYLIVAGGCNFPEPGKKKYYSGIYAAKIAENADSLNWKMIGNLPEPAAYGGVVTLDDSLIFIGGCNSEHSLRTVLSIQLDKKADKPIMHFLPVLPCTVDNGGVTVMGNQLFVVGGNQDGHPSSSLLRLDMVKNNKWIYEKQMPGYPRVQPVCAASNGTIYVWGGFYENSDSSVVFTSGLSYDLFAQRWTSLTSPKNLQGKELTLTGATAMIVNSSPTTSRVVCTGGVNQEIFLDAISGKYSLVEKENYLKKAISWYRFNDYLLVYDLKTEQWNSPIAESHLLARAGAQVALHGNSLYYVGGELKPGLRSAGIVRVDLITK